jgi:hypothetical protein
MAYCCCATVPDVDYCDKLQLPDFQDFLSKIYIFDAQTVEDTTDYCLVCSSGVGDARKAADSLVLMGVSWHGASVGMWACKL